MRFIILTVLLSLVNIGFGQNTMSSIHDDILKGKTLLFLHSENIKGAINPGPIDGCFILKKDHFYQNYNKDCDLSKGALYSISKIDFSNNSIQLEVNADMYGSIVNLFVVIEKHTSGWLVKQALQSSKEDFLQIDALELNYTDISN